MVPQHTLDELNIDEYDSLLLPGAMGTGIWKNAWNKYSVCNIWDYAIGE